MKAKVIIVTVGLITIAALGLIELDRQVMEIDQPENINDWSDLTLGTSYGDIINLKEAKGKFIIHFHFWTMDNMADLITFGLAREAIRVHAWVVPVVKADDYKEVRQFVRGYGVQFPIFLDTDGRLTEILNITKYPTEIVVDKQGKVRLRHEGNVKWLSFTTKFMEAIKKISEGRR